MARERKVTFASAIRSSHHTPYKPKPHSTKTVSPYIIKIDAIGSESLVIRPELLFGEVVARFKNRQFKELEADLKEWEGVLIVFNNKPFRWAASKGDIEGMRFIMEHISAEELKEVLSYKGDEAIIKFIDHCLSNDKLEILAEGVKIFLYIDKELTSRVIKEIAEEYEPTAQESIALNALIAEETTETAEEPTDPVSEASHAIIMSDCSGLPFGRPSPQPDDFYLSYSAGGGAPAGYDPQTGLIGAHNDTEHTDTSSTH